MFECGCCYEVEFGMLVFKVMEFECYCVCIEDGEVRLVDNLFNCMLIIELLGESSNLVCGELFWCIGMFVLVLILVFLVILFFFVNFWVGCLVNMFIVIFIYVIYSNLLLVS